MRPDELQRRAIAAECLDTTQEWPHECHTLNGRGAPCINTLLRIAAACGDKEEAAWHLHYAADKSHFDLLAAFERDHGGMSRALTRRMELGGFQRVDGFRLAVACDVRLGTGWFEHEVDGRIRRAFYYPRIPCFQFFDGSDWLAWFDRRLRVVEPAYEPGKHAEFTQWRARR